MDRAFDYTGFDVFMGNSRGNLYSTGHNRLNVSDHEYWKFRLSAPVMFISDVSYFSWDEVVKYDLDAMINKALTMTGHDSLYYIGHSQGTLVMFSILERTTQGR